MAEFIFVLGGFAELGIGGEDFAGVPRAECVIQEEVHHVILNHPIAENTPSQTPIRFSAKAAMKVAVSQLLRASELKSQVGLAGASADGVGGDNAHGTGGSTSTGIHLEDASGGAAAAL